jgi:ribosomal protein L22
MADDPKKPEETEAVEETDVVTEAVTDAAPEAEAQPAEKAEAETPAKKPARRTRKKAEAPAAEAEAKAPKQAKTPKATAKAGKAGAGAAATGERPVVRAHAKYVRTSARKARLVCDHIRGKSVIEARAILAHTPRAVAEDWSKLLESAIANAEHNHELIGDELRIISVSADEGPTLKRFRPRAMGRASSIRKRTSHLSIALTPKE